jgi:hypothetical protein
MAILNFSVAAGNSLELAIPVDGLELSGALAYWRLYISTYGAPTPLSVPMIEKDNDHLGGVVLVPSPESMIVNLTKTDTEDLAGNYYYEAKVNEHDGEVTTVAQGIVTVLETQMSAGP